MNEGQKIDRHICFVCDRAWPLFTSDTAKGIGGVETRSVRLAKMLLPYFTKVTFAIRKTDGEITNNYGLSVVQYEPAVISNAPNRDMAKIDADIYIVFESHHFTADIVRTCNILRKPVVYWCTSSIDFDIRYKLDNHEQYYWQFVGRESAYCFYMSDQIICQTEDQSKELLKNHGLPSTVIRNPIDIIINFEKRKRSSIETVLWIGRTDNVFKQPHKLVEVAKRLPEIKFLMIMNNTDNIIFNEILNNKTENVEIIEYVEPEEMPFIYEKCDLLLSTSSSEGFSNVFLEAIKYGIPVVSLQVDPDGMFTRHNCGFCCEGSIDKTIETIKRLNNNTQEIESRVRQALDYIKANHSIDVINDQMVSFFGSIPLNVAFPLRWADFNYNRMNELVLLELEKVIQSKHHSILRKLVSLFRKK